MVLLGLLLIIAGALAIPSLIAQKQPNAMEMINKLVPFQGIIGIILLLWGLYMLFADVLGGGLTILNAINPLWGILYLVTDIVSIGLGALLSYGLIAKYTLANNPDAARKGAELYGKLTKVQVPLGIAGIALGIFLFILRFVILPSYFYVG
jgi:hypothetical protein